MVSASNRACRWQLSDAVSNVPASTELRRARSASKVTPASDIDVYQAYVQYLTPFGPTIKAGKMATWVGSEVAEQTPTVYNFNITRGNVYNLLQPINHYGL